ncbi:Natural killer cells antigen CD94 [Lemmus lemmus]
MSSSIKEHIIGICNDVFCLLVSECCACLEKWVGYQCNCYFISKEEKSWEESRDFCAAKNSSLLHIKTRNEMNFMSSNQHYFWIGMRYNETWDAWLWEDGSSPSKDLLLKNHCQLLRSSNMLCGA